MRQVPERSLPPEDGVKFGDRTRPTVIKDNRHTQALAGTSL